MKRRIWDLLSVLRREAEFIIRDKDLITIILLSPIFYAFFYGSVYLNKSEKDVPVAIVDMDKSQLSATFARNLDSHQLVRVSEILPDLNSATDRIYSLKAHGILFIPHGFESLLKAGKGTDLKLYLNTSRFLVSNDINKAVNEVTGTFSAGIKLKYFQAQGYSIEQSKEMIEPLGSETRSLFNTVESYGDFLIPGLLVLIIQQTLLMGLSESVAKERENDLLVSLYNTANKSIWVTVIGKGLFYFLLYSSYALLFYTLHFSIFNISFRGSTSAVASLTVLFLAAVIFLAIYISSFFRRKIAALQFFAFTTYPFFLMSGYPWPQQAMPFYIRYLSYLLPCTPYLNAFNRLTQMGAGWRDIMPEFCHLLGLVLIGIVLTRIRVKSLLKISRALEKQTEEHGIANMKLSEVSYH